MPLLNKSLVDNVIDIGQKFYISASSSQADERTRVLLHNDTFAVFDRSGDILPAGAGPQGIFHNEMRHLSRFELSLCGKRPLLLSSTVREDNILLAVDLTNPELGLRSGIHVPQGTIHIYRARFLSGSVCHDRITVHNYGFAAFDLEIALAFDADFADVFEIRGEYRKRRGKMLDQIVERNSVALRYLGLDHVRRITRISCSAPGCHPAEGRITVPLHLEPQGEAVITIAIECRREDAPGQRVEYEAALHTLLEERAASPLTGVSIHSSSEQFNNWIRRSQSDLAMMITRTPSGLYPYAGVPWYSTVFGRDGILTAMEILWLAPDVAQGVLNYLARTQAAGFDPANDAEPGKILHEQRKGEMAALGEVPFGRYYGTIDATPLFLVLAAAYFERTGDTGFLRQIWPNILAALDWIDHYGDRDGDGFVEYALHTDHGLVQQGWKDSDDSVFHNDGRIADGPIALCEVQSYVYAARVGLAKVARTLSDPGLAGKLEAQADELQRRFSAQFWSDELGMFVLALDGDKRPCAVRTSNAGHCLFSGIASREQEQRVAQTLLGSEFFSGWGIRTLAPGEKRFNPMSYYNGSVWPHDGAMIAQGTLKWQNKLLALRVLNGLLELSQYVTLHRLPELICGFNRRPGKGPTLYPVACSPQARAAGAAFWVLQTCLGMEICAREQRINLHYSALPENLKHVQIRNLQVGEACVDLAFERYGDSVGVDITRRTGHIEIVTVR